MEDTEIKEEVNQEVKEEPKEETLGEFLTRSLDGLQIIFHWLCTIEDDVIRERFQKEVSDGNLFIFAPAMFLYYKKGDKWEKGELRFNMEDPAANAIVPVTRAHIGQSIPELLTPATPEEGAGL